MRILALLLFPLLLAAQTISDKKNALEGKSSSQDAEIRLINDNLATLTEKLERCYAKAGDLVASSANEEEYKQLLQEALKLKKEIGDAEEGFRESVVREARRDEEGYAIWDQEETTLAQLVMEYGSSDYLYVVPPELSQVKINMHSNIPIPRESWGSVLEMVLQHNGIGVKKVNAYTRQLFLLKQDVGSVHVIASRKEDLAWYRSSDRIFFIFSPAVEQVKSVFQFFERFSDPKQTFVHQVGNKIALVGTKEEIEKLLTLHQTVWEGHGGKVARVVSLSKMGVREMEKILTSFFGEAIEKNRPPFGKVEQDGLGIFPLGQSNTLVLIGPQETVARAEKIVQETEEQLEDPAEMTVYLYTCRHSDPTDLAKVLDKVYLSLIAAGRESAPKETDLSFAAQSASGGGKVPDGYPPVAPLVVSPPPLRPGVSAHLEVEQITSDHFIPDPKTGTLLMTVRRDVLVKVKELLKKLDVPKKMVQIEVLLFERRIRSQNNFGLNLLKLGESKNGLTYTPVGGPPVNSKGILQFFFHGPANKYTPHFDIAYNFLMTQDDIQLHAAPSVITVNQTPATISIVEEISINNGAAPVDTNKGTTFEKSFSRADYGIIINLTPTIHGAGEDEEKGSVTLHTDITFDTTKHHPDDRPMVDRRHVENEVRVTDGESVILGGLRRQSKEDREEKIPFFGEIPGIGKLFGSTHLSDDNTEMFFFITPKIVYDPKEELLRIRTDELAKRPGDIPEFLKRVNEARDKEKNRYFKQSMKLFFNHER